MTEPTPMTVTVDFPAEPVETSDGDFVGVDTPRRYRFLMDQHAETVGDWWEVDPPAPNPEGAGQ